MDLDSCAVEKKCKKSKHSEKKKNKSSETDCNSKSDKCKQNKVKKKKRKHSSSSSSSDSENEKKNKKLKRKLKKEAKKLRKLEKLSKEKAKIKEDEISAVECNIPIHLMEQSKSMAPMTKEEWEKKQSVIRKVYDEQTGRHRLIKGDGEVIEEIVSRDRHLAINRQATQGDAEYFQAQLSTNMSKR